jgi:hypothetical protein
VDAVVVVGAGVVVVAGASFARAPARVAWGCPGFGDALNASTAAAAVSVARRTHKPMLAKRAGHQCVGSALRDKGSSLADTPQRNHDTPGVYSGRTASAGQRRTAMDWLAVARSSPDSDHRNAIPCP